MSNKNPLAYIQTGLLSLCVLLRIFSVQ